MKKFLKYTNEEIIKAVRSDGYNLRYVKEQTEAMCIEAVKQNPYSLAYVRNQTNTICLEAVLHDGDGFGVCKRSNRIHLSRSY